MKRNRKNLGDLRVLVLNAPYFKKFSRPQRSPAVTKSGTLYFPIWLAHATGVLLEAGVQAELWDAPARGMTLEQVLDKAAGFAPHLVIMDMVTPSVENDLGVAVQIKSRIKTKIFAVGTHPSAAPEETLLASDALDGLCIGEYDYTVLDLAKWAAGTMSLEEIPGIVYRRDGEAVWTEARAPIEDLDALPFVAPIYKRFLRIEDYFNPNALYPMVTINSGRGCPNGCTFCVYPQTMHGRHYRFRSPENVVEEMEYVIKHFPEAKSIFFEDDTLPADKRRCIEFCELINRREIKFPWTANCRVDVDYETLRAMRQGGCRMVCVGFESGEQALLDAIHKGTKVEMMARFARDARKAGILVHGCFMVGLPGETRETMQKTLDLALRISPDTAQFYPIMVYPGTELYDQYLEEGLLTVGTYSEWLTDEGLHNCVVRAGDISGEELVVWCDEARRKFYLRPGYILRKVAQMLLKPSEISRTKKAARTFFKFLFRGSFGKK
ncbi:MAG: radical SAM protein [Candidatus Coatesbacteria bacterium]|nr:radical SAM protein [Candidatus Coatesbacteria bacterium]